MFTNNMAKKSQGGSRRPRKSKKMVSTAVNKDVPTGIRRDVSTSSVSVPSAPTHYVFRQLDPSGSTVSGVVGSASYNAHAGQLAFLGNVAAFSALFDQYRIVALRYTLIPRTNVVSGTAYNPPLYTIVDYDDASPLSSRNAFTQRANVTVSQVWQSVSRTFKPHAALAAYSGAFTSYANATSPWIDLNSTTVPHYGFKWYIDSCNTPAPVWDMEIEYWIEFRNII